MNDYIDAIINVKVPKWQIGEECSVFFKDSMCVKGVCRLKKEENDAAENDNA